MIRFLLTRGRDYCIEGLIKDFPPNSIIGMTYDRLIRSRRFASATTIFSDLDRLSYADLELSARIYLQLRDKGERVLNNPANFKRRDTLLRLLHAAGLNDFNAYRPHELSADMHFPVFIRKIQGHGLASSGLLHDRASVEEHLKKETASGVPIENLTVIEYVGEPVIKGLFRKISIFRIGDEIVPYLCAHDPDWFVKIGKKGVATEDLYREELRFVQDNPFADHFRTVFDLAGLEYGRADFGFYKGRIQVFEINTNPSLGYRIQHPSPYRMETGRLLQEKFREAFRKIDSPRRTAVVLPRELVLNQHRGRHGLLIRTRQVD